MPRDFGGRGPDQFPLRGQPALPPAPGPLPDAAAADYRRGLGELEARNNARFDAIDKAMREGSLRVEDLVRAASRGPLSGPGAGLGMVPAVLPDLAAAFRDGCCVPDVLVIDLFAPRGETGQIANGIVTDTTGPNLISEIVIWARISPNDPTAANFAQALIQPPPPTSCPPGPTPCPPQMLFSCPGPSGTEGASLLLPIVDVRGASIPVGFREVRLLCCGFTECEVTVRDPVTQELSTFPTQVPLVIPDHPEALDAEVEFFTNNVAWQYSAIPADFFYRPYSITEQRPDCMGMCGFIACLQQLTAAFNIVRAPRFDLEIKVGFAGFRIQSCGGLCNTIGA